MLRKVVLSLAVVAAGVAVSVASDLVTRELTRVPTRARPFVRAAISACARIASAKPADALVMREDLALAQPIAVPLAAASNRVRALHRHAESKVRLGHCTQVVEP